MKTIDEIKNYSQLCYDNSNCMYDGNNYFTHINMVVGTLTSYLKIFNSVVDFENTLRSAYTHDLLEDTKETWDDIFKNCGKDIADITLAVTDVPAENRLMKHLLTMHRTVTDYRAIILKMCDMHANASYSKEHGSSMYKKYQIEYPYRKAIFQIALGWYKDYLNQMELNLLWKELDEIHNFNIK